MTTPTTSYKVAVTNEDWSPLIGVEIEAMNLTTLMPDDVQTTGLDGVAIFTGLTGGPHFFKVRDRRVSTAISADLSVENQGRVRSYIGAIHVQVIAMGNQGITKHYIIDASGLGTHTTVQAAITAAIALGLGFEVVIYCNPGAYTEDLTAPFASTGGSIYLVGEGAVVNLNTGAYNSIVTIAGSSGSSPVLEATGVGTIATVGIEFAQKTGGSAEVIKLAVNNDLEMYECKMVACAGQRAFTAVIDVRCRNCVITAASGRIIDPANAVYFEHCYLNGAGLIKGNFDLLVVKDCILVGTAPAGEYWIHEAALVVSRRLYVIGCESSAGGGSGFISFGDPSAVSTDCIITNNKINVGSSQIGIRLIELVAAVVTDNIIRGTSNSDGSTAISLAGAVGGACRACVVAHNSIYQIQTGINRGTDATDGTCVIGPNAFYDVGTNTTGVPGGEDYEVNIGDLDHVLLDANLHTDTVAQAVSAGSLVIGNDTPAWDELVVSVPAANVRNVLGVDNGETTPSWKTALDGTNPADIAGSASPGTSLVFAHRDHIHKHPTGLGADLHHTAFTASDHTTIGDSSPHHARYTGAEAIAAVEGEATLALDGAITEIHGDANFTLSIVSSNPRITFDSGDYLEYNRAGNYLHHNQSLDVAGHARFGADATLQTDRIIDAYEDFDFSSGDRFGMVCVARALLTGDSTGSLRGLRCTARLAGAYDIAYIRGIESVSYIEVAGSVTVEHSGFTQEIYVQTGVAATVAAVYGFNFVLFDMEDATVTDAYGVYTRLPDVDTGSVQTAYGVYLKDATVGAGEIVTAYGLYLEDIDSGNTNYGIYFAGTSGLARQGIWWNGDTNLYRSAANTLKTDDDLVVAGGAITIGADCNLYRLSANRLTTDDALDVRGTLRVGVYQTIQGLIFIHGPGTGQSVGGRIRVDVAEDYAGSFVCWYMDTYQDDWRLIRSIGTVMGTLTAEGQWQLPTVGSGAGVLLGGDALIYRSAANVLRTPDSLVVDGTLAVGTVQTYTPSNVSTDRSYDADATTLDEVADVLGTLIADLQTIGLLQ